MDTRNVLQQRVNSLSQRALPIMALSAQLEEALGLLGAYEGAFIALEQENAQLRAELGRIPTPPAE